MLYIWFMSVYNKLLKWANWLLQMSAWVRRGGQDVMRTIAQNLVLNNTIEAFTHGNPSPLFERNFSYRMSPVLRATLWPNQWSHRLLLGIKWKIWTLSFHWYPLIFCGLSSLDTAASQSQAFFQKVKNAENWPVLPRSKTQIFWHFFSNGCHS